jgi:tetratricopeptide (TPR) repeat protein
MRGRVEEARAIYQELLQSPTWAPAAHLELGEMAFDQAASDATKWSEAEHQYAEAVKAPPPDNRSYGYAWYKLAYVYWNEGDGPKCIDAFQQAIDYGTRFSQLPKAAQIAEVARRDLVAANEQLGAGSQDHP